MEVGVIYLKLVFPKGHKLGWLSHCGMNLVLPKDIYNEIKILTKKINTEYADDIIIPMDCRVMPGCTTKPESVDKVAKSMYDGFVYILNKLGVKDGGPRCVYSVGELSNVDVKSTHHLGNDEVMIKLGHFLDESDEPGLFKI